MTIVEFIRYKLRENAKTDDFLKAAEKMIPDLKKPKRTNKLAALQGREWSLGRDITLEEHGRSKTGC